MLNGGLFDWQVEWDSFLKRLDVQMQMSDTVLSQSPAAQTLRSDTQFTHVQTKEWDKHIISLLSIFSASHNPELLTEYVLKQNEGLQLQRFITLHYDWLWLHQCLTYHVILYIQSLLDVFKCLEVYSCLGGFVIVLLPGWNLTMHFFFVLFCFFVMDNP